MRRQKNEVLIDTHISEDGRLKNFIECFSDETAVCEELGPVEFVNRAIREMETARWLAGRGSAEPADSDPLGMEPGSIFVSYSSAATGQQSRPSATLSRRRRSTHGLIASSSKPAMTGREDP